MHIVGRWRSTPWSEAKYTLDSVPNELKRLRVLYTVAPYGESSFTYPPSLFSPILFAATALASLAPARLMSAYFHHRIPTHAPDALSDPSYRSNSDHVVMYCATLFSAAGWSPPSSGTPYPHLPLPTRCTSTSHQVSAAGDVPSAVSPLGPENPPWHLPCRG